MTLFRKLTAILVSSLLAVLTGCGGTPHPSSETKFRPVDEKAAVFWDRQTTEYGELLRNLVAEFNAAHPGLPMRVEHTGGYSDIFRKVSASIQAGMLPAMALSYETMTAEYIPTGAAVNLDKLIAEPGSGLSPEEIADYVPAALEPNRYADHGGAIYSFPLSKSILMMFFNRKVLAEAGIAGPPQTWTEFLDACRKIKAKTGRPAHAIHADCSTVDGMIFSRGGEVIRGRETLFDSPQAVEVFGLYATLGKEGLAYLITPGSYDDNLALSKNEIAFVFRTSSARGDIMLIMDRDKERWGMARIPQSDVNRPSTVLFGPNVTLFNTSEEQKRTAWAFVKWFTSPEINARWAAGTGYLPVRKSAMNQPVIQELFKDWEYNRAPFDCLPFAKSEPNMAGWQQVRDMVTRTLTEVVSGTREPKEAAAALKKAADEVLARANRG